MTIRILSRWDRSIVLYESEAPHVRAALVEAVAKRVVIGSANLRSADLRGADLRSANLGGADLGGADLRSANLRSADLGGADLGGAYLVGANLGRADLGNRRVLQIGGSAHWIVAIQTPESLEIAIGCQRLSLADWRKRGESIAAENDYTPDQVEEYRAHLDYVEAWSRMAPVPVAEAVAAKEVTR